MSDEGLQRLRWLEERRKLAEAIGVTIPTQPPRLSGETDKEYGIRLAEIAKSHCGPPPRPKTPPRKPPTIKPQGFDPPESTDDAHTAPDADRLGGMIPDFTTPEEL
jgi:hypothetical protein